MLRLVFSWISSTPPADFYAKGVLRKADFYHDNDSDNLSKYSARGYWGYKGRRKQQAVDSRNMF